MQCPACQSEAPGAYCPACGAPVEGARCKACEAPLLAGAHYCIQCGTPVRPAGSRVSWIVAGAALTAMLVVLLVPSLRPQRAAPPATGLVLQPATGAAGASLGTPPPLTGTPREQADRLFNRVMQAAANGDSAQASFFLPMAIQAYRRVGELDDDGLYHLSVLELAAGDAAGARTTAERLLAASPDHLLALGAAARAALAAGDRTTARKYYTRLLSVFDAQSRTATAEYQDHARILPEYREEAEAFLQR